MPVVCIFLEGQRTKGPPSRTAPPSAKLFRAPSRKNETTSAGREMSLGRCNTFNPAASSIPETPGELPPNHAERNDK